MDEKELENIRQEKLEDIKKQKEEKQKELNQIRENELRKLLTEEARSRIQNLSMVKDDEYIENLKNALLKISKTKNIQKIDDKQMKQILKQVEDKNNSETNINHRKL